MNYQILPLSEISVPIWCPYSRCLDILGRYSDFISIYSGDFCSISYLKYKTEPISVTIGNSTAKYRGCRRNIDITERWRHTHKHGIIVQKIIHASRTGKPICARLNFQFSMSSIALSIISSHSTFWAIWRCNLSIFQHHGYQLGRNVQQELPKSGLVCCEDLMLPCCTYRGKYEDIVA